MGGLEVLDESISLNVGCYEKEVAVLDLKEVTAEVLEVCAHKAIWIG